MYIIGPYTMCCDPVSSKETNGNYNMHHAVLTLSAYTKMSTTFQVLTDKPATDYNILIYTIDLYQPWKITRGRADITLATGWYSVSDGRLQTAAHALATDVSDWLLQAARHYLADM